jgi:hypothetical protein
MSKQRVYTEKQRAQGRERARLWGLKNPERVRESHRSWAMVNSEHKKAMDSKWARNNRERAREAKRRWKLRNRDYPTRKRTEDIGTRLSGNLRTRIRSVLKRNKKLGSAVKDLGCTLAELRFYLEQQFYNRDTGEVMGWSNYGQNGWHVDHIKPLCKFDLSEREQFRQAVHYTNLRPLWSEHNLEKSNKEDWVLHPKSGYSHSGEAVGSKI